MKKAIIILLCTFIITALICSCAGNKNADTDASSGTEMEPAVAEYIKNRGVDEYGRNTTASAEKPEANGNGVELMGISNQVHHRETASIAIKGPESANYTIKVYDENGVPADIGTGTETQADETGFASCMFTISPEVKQGTYIILFKADGTDKYLQTTMTVTA